MRVRVRAAAVRVPVVGASMRMAVAPVESVHAEEVHQQASDGTKLENDQSKECSDCPYH